MVTGFVQDQNNQPIPLVNVYTKMDVGTGTATDSEGKYILQLEPGKYWLIFSALGYEDLEIEIILGNEVLERNIYLKQSTTELDELTVQYAKKDPAYEVMKKASDLRVFNNQRVHHSTCEFYYKATELRGSNRAEQTAEQQEVDDFDDPYFDPAKHADDSLRDLANSLAMVEIKGRRYYLTPNYVKEIRTGYKKVGSDNALYLPTAAHFNFYESIVDLAGVTELPVISPLNPLAVVSYKFKLDSTYVENERLIHRVGVKPRKSGGSVVDGWVDIDAMSFEIVRLQLSPDRVGMVTYREFSIEQFFRTVSDSIAVLGRQNFNYQIKERKQLFTGMTVMDYHAYSLDTIHSQKFFKNEVAATVKGAYNRDSTYWSAARPEPLTAEEQMLVMIQDSIATAQSKPEYLDSIDAAYNKITAAEVLWSGLSFYNREKKVKTYYVPILELVQPVALGGPRAQIAYHRWKVFENYNALSTGGNLSYGFRNEDFKGTVNAHYSYNQFKHSFCFANLSHDFNMTVDNSTLTGYLDRANYIDEYLLHASWGSEPINGLEIQLHLHTSYVQPIDELKFGNIAEQIVANNVPRSFDPYTRLVVRANAKYTPFQKYITEPHRKTNLGSKWPSIEVHYKRGIPGFIGSIVNFDFVEGFIQQQMRVRTIGTSEYKIGLGKFITDEYVTYQESKIFPRGDRWLFNSPLFNQLQDTTLATKDLFFEAHYVHRFNGAIVNLVPLVKKLKVHALGGVNYTFVKEASYHYADAYFGGERIFRIGRERYRLGLFLVYGMSNFNRGQPAIQIAANYVEKRTSQWD